MSQSNLDLGALQENKIIDGIYTRGSAGYSVVATDASIQHRGGVEVFYRASHQFTVEVIKHFRPHVVRFQLVTGERRWCIIECYFTPDGALTIERFIAALIERPHKTELLVAGYFNMELTQPEVARRDEEITTTLGAAGLEDMVTHFLP